MAEKTMEGGLVVRAGALGGRGPPVVARVPAAWGDLRIVVISDTHERHDELPNLGSGDVLIHCGDWTNCGNPKAMRAFLSWFAAQDFALRVLIAGNHEVTMCPRMRELTARRYTADPEKMAIFHEVDALMRQFEDDIVVLSDESLIVDVPGAGSIHLFGTSRISGGSHAVNERWGFYDRDDDWADLPDDVDILITHVPPINVLDTHSGHCLGSPGLLSYVSETRPLLHVFGHVHSGHGLHLPRHMDSPTLFVNAACCTDDWAEPLNPPMMIRVTES